MRIQSIVSQGKNHLLEDLTVGDFHELYRYRAVSSDWSREAKIEWLDTWLEERYPDFTPYEREVAGLKALSAGLGKGKTKLICECPKCQDIPASPNMLIDFKIDSIKPFFIDIMQDDAVAFRVHFKDPESAGAVFGPEKVEDKRYVEFTPAELKAQGERLQLGDIVIQDGEEKEYDGFGTPELVIRLNNSTPTDWEELEPELRSSIEEYMLEYEKESILTHSRSPLNCQQEFRCQRCKYRVQNVLPRLVDVIDSLFDIELGQWKSELASIVSWAQVSGLSFLDLKKMNYLEYHAYTAALLQTHKEK